MAKESDLDFAIWQPILVGKVTLHELETHYSVSDLYDLLEGMSIEQALQDEAKPKKKQS